MNFRPTRRTQILMAGVVVAGLVGAYTLWRNAEAQAARRAAAQATSAPEPSFASPEQGRAAEQLRRRFGEYALIYASQNGTTVCGYIQPRRAPSGPGGLRRATAFVATPERLTTAEDTPTFDQILASSCPDLPGARRPTTATPGPSDGPAVPPVPAG